MGVATGTFTLPNGSPVANGLYQWKLSQDTICTVTSACICPPLFYGNLDTNGNMTATFLFNDVLTPSGSTYQLTVKGNAGQQVWNEIYYLTGTAANLNNIPPGGGSTITSGTTLIANAATAVPLPRYPADLNTDQDRMAARTDATAHAATPPTPTFVILRPSGGPAELR